MKFIIEQSAYSGVLKIAGKVAHDMELVTGTLPEIRWMHRKISRRMC